ncbi:MAG: PhoU family transcriptional regulator [Campylobacteraceae bacterium]|jgi:phosphate transport system protein|nr:PhoU family transcriptional regulator [Campylobacteraceae bacterium]
MLLQNEEKLNKIRSAIGKIGIMIIDAGSMVSEALLDGDKEWLEKARDKLKNIDADANRTDNEIVASLALFGAEAGDLRELVSYLKITNEFVRMADNLRGFAKNITLYIDDAGRFVLLKEYVTQLYKASMSAVTTAIGLIGSKDNVEELYRKVMVEENKSDDLYALMEKNVLDLNTLSDDFIANYAKILNTVRKLEKMADRAVAVAKLVLFAKSGGELKLY